MAETVVGSAFLRVFQRLIGLAQFLELGFGLLVARIAVRVVFHGLFAEGTLERAAVGIAGYA